MALALLLALLMITLLGVYLFVFHPWWFPPPAALHATTLDHQFISALWVLGSLFIAGQLVLAILVIRSRSKPGATYSKGNWRFETTWTLLIAALFFWFNVTGERVWSEVKIHAQEHDRLRVEITGTQFQWYFRYPGPDGVWGRINAQRFARPSEGNPLGIDPDDPAGKDDIISAALVLPVNHEVELTLRAQDVIHSIFIPAMRFKQDAVPGMDIHAHLKPIQTGTFELACSQLCGLGHYRMRATVKIVSEEEFKQWLRVQTPQASTERR